jgi:uncharacterized protein YkwD
MRPRIWVLRSAALMVSISVISGCANIFGPSGSDSPGDVERETYFLVNSYRSGHGLTELAWNDIIAGEARKHSEEMADGRTPFGHDGFQERIDRIGAVVRWSKAAENIALAPNADEAVASWINSPTHRVHLEENYDLTGVGVAASKLGSGFYITQIFIKRR